MEEDLAFPLLLSFIPLELEQQGEECKILEVAFFHHHNDHHHCLILVDVSIGEDCEQILIIIVMFEKHLGWWYLLISVAGIIIISCSLVSSYLANGVEDLGEDPCGGIRRLSWPVNSVNHHPLQPTCRCHHRRHRADLGHEDWQTLTASQSLSSSPWPQNLQF